MINISKPYRNFLKIIPDIIFLKHKVADEFLKFIVVGVFSTAVNYSFFYIFFTKVGVMYLVSSAIGYMVGVVFSYFGNKIATFDTSASFKKKEFILFFFVYLVSLCISLVALHFFVTMLGLSVLLANLFAIGISTVTNFTMLKLFLF